MNENTTARSAVELSVPLTAEFASAIRVLVSSVAADLDFTIDELDDLRLAVSEVFTVLADDGAVDPSARCDTTIDVADGGVEIAMTRDVGGPIELDELASTILSSVVDGHQVIDRGIVIRKRAAEAFG